MDEWTEITDYDVKRNLIFAFKQREKYGSPVEWKEKNGLFAVCIPQRERNLNKRITGDTKKIGGRSTVRNKY